jgi:hypothetical protein
MSRIENLPMDIIESLGKLNETNRLLVLKLHHVLEVAYEEPGLINRFLRKKPESVVLRLREFFDSQMVKSKIFPMQNPTLQDQMQLVKSGEALKALIGLINNGELLRVSNFEASINSIVQQES